MFGNNFQIERIRTDAQQDLVGKDEQLLSALWNWTCLVFEKWKQEHGDRNPIPNRGMLSDLLPIPFDKAEPWECSNFIFSSPIALAMKLLAENYPPFAQITDKVGIRNVLALAIVKSDHAAYDDLYEAGEILLKLRVAEDMGKVVFNKYRTAIEAQKSRKTGGNSRAEQLKEGKEDKHKRIREAKKNLPSDTKPHHITKEIAKATGLETDYVRKARKEMENKTSGS